LVGLRLVWWPLLVMPGLPDFIWSRGAVLWVATPFLQVLGFEVALTPFPRSRRKRGTHPLCLASPVCRRACAPAVACSAEWVGFAIRINRMVSPITIFPTRPKAGARSPKGLRALLMTLTPSRKFKRPLNFQDFGPIAADRDSPFLGTRLIARTRAQTLIDGLSFTWRQTDLKSLLQRPTLPFMMSLGDMERSVAAFLERALGK